MSTYFPNSFNRRQSLSIKQQRRLDSKSTLIKTKNLRINAQQNDPITLSGDDIEDVSHFTYLGSIVNTTGGADEDIRVRKGKDRQAFIISRPVWRNRNVSLKTKLRIFETNVKSVLLYGSEAWKQRNMNKISKSSSTNVYAKF
jgi:hypothetical protein